MRPQLPAARGPGPRLAAQHGRRLRPGLVPGARPDLAGPVRRPAAVRAPSSPAPTLRMTTRITGLRRVWARRETRSCASAMAPSPWPARPSTGSSSMRHGPTGPGARRHRGGVRRGGTRRSRRRGSIWPCHPTSIRRSIPGRSASATSTRWPTSTTPPTWTSWTRCWRAPPARSSAPTPPVRYEVEYLRSAMPRSVVSVRHWPDGTACTFQLTDEADQELIRARVQPG